MFSHIKNTKDLIGEKIECLIGEPWDFESEADQNKIIGEIIDVSNEEDKKLGVKDWILCKITPFDIKNNQIRFIYASKRYVKDDLIKDLIDGKSVVCNFPYDKSGKDLSNVKIREAYLDNNFEGFGGLAGNIKIIDQFLSVNPKTITKLP